MPLLVGYVRVSGDSQEDNTSLPVQREAILNYCRSSGHELFAVFEDVASGAGTEKRKGLMRALSVIGANLAEGLIVYKQDRLARNAADSESIRLMLDKANKLLLFVVDPIEASTSEGALFFQIKSIHGEYERRVINQRCSAGRERKKQEPGFRFGGSPFGWQAKKGALIEIEAEQKVIRRIFELRSKRLSEYAIAAKLNKEGYKTKRGKPWGGAHVHAVIDTTPRIIEKLSAVPKQSKAV